MGALGFFGGRFGETDPDRIRALLRDERVDRIRLKDQQTVLEVIRMVNDSDPAVSKGADRALYYIKDNGAEPWFRDSLGVALREASTLRVAHVMAELLGSLQDPEARRCLMEVAADPSRLSQAAAMHALRWYGEDLDKEWAMGLVDRFGHASDPDVREAAIGLLDDLTSNLDFADSPLRARAFEKLVEACDDSCAEIRKVVASALHSYYREAAALRCLLRLMADESVEVRSSACWSAQYFTDSRRVQQVDKLAEALQGRLSDSDESVSSSAKFALDKIR